MTDNLWKRDLDIMNDALTDALVRREILVYKAETLLIEAIDKKDFDGAKFLCEIISAYLPLVQTERINNTIEEYNHG